MKPEPRLATSRARLVPLLLALSMILSGALAQPRPIRAATTVSLDEVSEGLTCQCGCGLTVANCNHPQCEFSVPVREQIEGMIKGGMSRAQIIGIFRAKYGEKILSAPTTQGFNLLAWLMPFGAIAAGCGLLVVVAGRWRAANADRDPAAPAAPPGAQDSFDPVLRRRLEADVKENA